MRDKLKELILEYRNYPQKTCPRYDETPCDGCKYDLDGECDEVGRLTDHLIANNVFVLPEKLNDSWELALPFMMRLFATDEEQIEKVHREFERKEVKQILTDIRNYLVAKAEFVREMNMEFLGQSAMLQLLAIEQKKLKEYAEKLGVEL